MTECREPIIFAQGDSLIFQRSLPAYLPSAGWSLLYEIRSVEQPTYPAIQFVSTPDATNSIHEIDVLPAVTIGWLPGDSILAGYAVNVSGERHQIYYGELNLMPNLGTPENTVDVQTHAQKMIPLIEAQLESLAAHAIDDSNIQQVEIRRTKRMELEKQLAWNKQLRANEVATENVKNGRPSGNNITPTFRIINPGFFPGGSVSWPFPP